MGSPLPKLLFTALVSASNVGWAATTATFNSSAEIVAPIAIEKTSDMAFARVASSAAGGSVHIAPDGSRSGAAGRLLQGGNATAAVFKVTGAPNTAFVVTLPDDGAINSGANAMQVRYSVSDVNGGLHQTTDSSGTKVVALGGTLDVAANQPTGMYNGTFVVAVNY